MKNSNKTTEKTIYENAGIENGIRNTVHGLERY